MGCVNSQEATEKKVDDTTKVNDTKLILFNSTYKNTPPFFPSFKECKVVKIYDADTWHAAAIVDGKVQRFMIRMMGYDSPELRTKNPAEKKAALEAKDALVKRMDQKMVQIEIIPKKEKYGRLLAIVRDEQGEVNKWMVDHGYGKPYFGGKKEVFGE